MNPVKSPNRDKVVMQLPVGFDSPPSQALEVVAHVFNRKGQWVATASVKEGAAKLPLTQAEMLHARIFLVSAQEQVPERPTLADMARARAYEPVAKPNLGKQAYELLPIPKDIWRDWLVSLCRVRGVVVKPITIFHLTLPLPVCHARVHICEVDRLPVLIGRLPDREIFRLRDEFLKELVKLPVVQPPEPDPGPLHVFDRMNRTYEELAWLNPQPEPPLPIKALAGAKEFAINPQPEPPGTLELPLALRAELFSSSAQIVRKGLTGTLEIIRPYLCRFPFLTPFLRCDELAVIDTDEHGRFDTLITYRRGGDQPDLYFWVEYFYRGAWVTVYHPSMRCNTYWDYTCSTEVTVRVTDPRVTPCRPHPTYLGPLVSVYGVGQLVPVEGIDAAGYATDDITINDVTVVRRPFGGVLGLWADFANEELATAGVTHYLWSYRKAGEDAWKAITLPFGRRYRADFPPANSLSKLYRFEMDATGKFRIPPDEPWLDDGATDGNWEDPSVNGIATALFDTTTLPALSLTDPEHLGESVVDHSGTYELKLELFGDDGARVDLTDKIGIQVQDLATLQPDGSYTWKDAAGSNLYREGGRLYGFQMKVHVDNNPPFGDLLDVKVHLPGATLPGDIIEVDECGFIDYPAGAEVDLSFRAGHLHDEAVFFFAISRGSSGRIEVAKGRVDVASATSVDPRSDPAPVLGTYGRSIYTFERTATVAQLLSDVCNRGAFAEELYVYAIATDGWSRCLWWMDRYVPVKAFALAQG